MPLYRLFWTEQARPHARAVFEVVDHPAKHWTELAVALAQAGDIGIEVTRIVSEVGYDGTFRVIVGRRHMHVRASQFDSISRVNMTYFEESEVPTAGRNSWDAMATAAFGDNREGPYAGERGKRHG